MPSTIDLSVIITCHAEGILLHKTFASVQRAIQQLGDAYTSEIIIHIDNPTSATEEYIDLHSTSTLKDAIIFKNSFGDLGSSRNYSISHARGTYIATIDADDIMSKDWLRSAIEFLQKQTAPTIAHSEYTVEFEGADSLIVKHGEIDYDTDTLLSVYANRWNSVIVAPRALMLANPYAANSPGFGYEDWQFNCRMIYKKIHNVLIPETAIFVRRKRANSEWLRQMQSRSVLHANPLLDFKNIRSVKNILMPSANMTVTSSLENTSAFNRAKQIIKRYPLAHRVAKRVKSSVTAHTIPKNGDGGRVPKWLAHEWRDLHDIERQIFLDDALARNIRLYDTISPDHKAAGGLYKSLIDQLRFDTYDYVIFVPWLVAGGADKYAIEYANTIASLNANWRVLVIATLPSKSVWQSRLDDRVDFLDFGNLAQSVTREIQDRVMEHIVENGAARAIHIINSEFGYDFIREHETYIRSKNIKVIVTSFSQSVRRDGRLYGYSHTHVPYVYDLATLITSDNQAVIDMWSREYGFDASKMVVHHQPIGSVETRRKTSYDQKTPIRILWAARVAPEKLPELIPEIAHDLGEGFHIDMYGSAENVYATLLAELPRNVSYRNAYDGFESLDVASYDMLLYTSLFDGMPNTILEAATSGLPIIASSVGGIPEFVIDHNSGLLITDIHDPKSYAQAIRLYSEDSSLAKNCADHALHQIQKIYSRTAYEDAVATMLKQIGL